MSEVQIKIGLDNQAFEECPTFEVARILRELADRIEGHPNFSAGHSQPLRDINGNEVGSLDVC